MSQVQVLLREPTNKKPLDQRCPAAFPRIIQDNAMAAIIELLIISGIVVGIFAGLLQIYDRFTGKGKKRADD